MEGYWPLPHARERLAHATVIPLPSAQASLRTGTAGHCAGQHASPVGTFSKWAILHHFPKFYALRVKIFRMFFIRSRLPATTMNDEKFHVFEKSGRQTHTETGAAALYI